MLLFYFFPERDYIEKYFKKIQKTFQKYVPQNISKEVANLEILPLYSKEVHEHLCLGRQLISSMNKYRNIVQNNGFISLISFWV